MAVFAGRYTAHIEGDFVVFLIGARVNTWRGLRQFGWIGQANGAMYAELAKHPEKGFLGTETFFRFPPLELVNISYWRSVEHLQAFAHAKDDPHLPAWRKFNQLIGDDGSVGIWHETYLVKAGEYEVIYGNMPRFGLAQAAEHLPVSERNHTARGRLGREDVQAQPETV